MTWSDGSEIRPLTSARPMSNGTNGNGENGRHEMPQDEMAHRAADLMPPFAALATAIGLENIRAIMADARQRTRDGHKFMARAAGAKDDDIGRGGEEAMGDISIIGEQRIYSTSSAPPATQAPAPTLPAAPASTPTAGGLPAWAKAALVGLGVVGAGAGGAGLMALWSRPQATYLKEGLNLQLEQAPAGKGATP